MLNLSLLKSGLPLLVAGVLIAGCGEADPRVPLSGTVTWNGKPIEDGTITLVPTDNKSPSSSSPIKDGAFSIEAYPAKSSVAIQARRVIGTRPPGERVTTPEPIYFQYLPPAVNERSAEMKTIEGPEEHWTIDLKGQELVPDKAALGLK